MRITIENLPPIASGSFELRPLTIFIGPNNTGKSRAASVAHAITYSLHSASRSPNPSLVDTNGEESGWAEDAILRVIQRRFHMALHRLLELNLQEYLALADHDRGQTSGLAASTPLLTIQADENLRITATGARPVAVVGTPNDIFAKLVGTAREPRSDKQRPPHGDAFPYTSPDDVLWKQLMAALGLPGGASYYFPSARGALASLWSWYLSLALSAAGARDADVLLPALPREFLQSLLRAASLNAAAKGSFRAPMAAVDLMERAILKGRVSVRGTPSMPTSLIYSNIFEDDRERYSIELSSASSSIAEIGPVAMILKALAEPGDLVVIDEPEAHLHPESERRMAQVLVRLANAGITVVVPTHSSTIVHQVSNLARAFTLSALELDELGLEASDRLSPDDIGVYLFKSGDGGSTIEEISFDPGFGYSEETFVGPAEALSDESYWIDTKLLSAQR